MEKLNYKPPSDYSKIQLSEALAGTPKFPRRNQSDLFGEAFVQHKYSDILLYCAGDISLLKRPCVAVVGSRKASPEGEEQTAKLTKDLALSGMVVVSGLAEGIDTVALNTAIEAGGKVIAVIGTSLDKAFPAKNKSLQEEIYRNHLLVSQFPIGDNIRRANFPQRNRLMAIISDGTVIMEASDVSGTRHQAEECAKHNRWLFIHKQVTENKGVSWPQNFINETTLRGVETVNEIVRRIG